MPKILKLQRQITSKVTFFLNFGPLGPGTNVHAI